ncbi:MAG: apolipoprotein A1/A4/E family protein [Chlorobi bacterium]|nr:apolipoprotein A1/A4/E family protein [Chlorobiota bacterium]
MKVRSRRLWLSVTAIAIVAAPLFLTSCSSSNDIATAPTTPGDEVATTLIVSNQPIDQWEASDNEVLPLKPPVGNGDDNGGISPHDSMAKRGRPLPIPCLGLTPEQMAQLQEFQAQLETANQAVFSTIQEQLNALRQREQAAWEAFRAATAGQREQVAALYRQFRAQVDSIRKLVRSGAISRSDARAILRQLAQDFQAARKAILDSTADARAQLKAELDQIAQERKALMDSIKPQLDANYQQFLANVASILTPEQLEIWQRWLNGEDPCKGRRPRG